MPTIPQQDVTHPAAQAQLGEALLEAKTITDETKIKPDKDEGDKEYDHKRYQDEIIAFFFQKCNYQIVHPCEQTQTRRANSAFVMSMK